MKKIFLMAGIVTVLLLAASCSKERTCRCTVLGNQTIRIIKIDKGVCEDLRYVLYDRDPVLYPDITDSVLCTDFDFEPYMND
jgi:hypothetical protein